MKQNIALNSALIGTDVARPCTVEDATIPNNVCHSNYLPGDNGWLPVSLQSLHFILKNQLDLAGNQSLAGN